ncbi:MAG: 1-acyl-sn-glycerol-3-phosphate acyltransferase [Pseudomonadota bacterium]
MEASVQQTNRPFRVDVLGAAPVAVADEPRLLLFIANTAAERELLQEYSASLPAGAPKPVWISIEGREETIRHDGLTEMLAEAPDLRLTPVGVLWRGGGERASGRIRAAWAQERLLTNDRLQRRTIKSHPERCAILYGEDAFRSALKARFARTAEATEELGPFADYIARQAALTVQRDSRKFVQGPAKLPRFVAPAVWARVDFQTRLAEIARDQGRPLDEVRQEARACLSELIPRARPFYVALGNAILRFARRLGYEEHIVYAKEEVERVRQTALTKPTAFLFTHKSHVDGMVLMNATYDEEFPLVHMIGGNNMAFLGMGYVMRQSGTVFIRRATKGDDVYKAALRHYLAYLLEKRFPIAWSLEGTRSRNGKLMPPRFGILKYVVEAAAKNSMSDLHLFPVSIYYDLIAEVTDYAHEQTGGAKRPESLAWFADYLRSLRKPLGRLSMAFGEPVVVDASQDEYRSSAGQDPDAFSIALQKLGFEASVSANNATPITPSAVMALVLSRAAPQALTEEEASADLVALLRWAGRRNIPMTEDLKAGDESRVRAVAEAMIEVGVVSRYDEGLEPVFAVSPDQYFAASYYRNSVVHFFVDKAICELAALKAAEVEDGAPLNAFWTEIAALRDLFKFEFFYPEWETHQAQLRKELARWDSGWETLLASGQAAKLLSRGQPLLAHAVLRPFAEAYTVVADVLLHLEPGADDGEKPVVAAALKLGKQLYLQRRIAGLESVGRLMFSNGYRLAANRGLFDVAGDVTGARVGFLRELSDVARRIRQIEAICTHERAQAQVGVRGLASTLAADEKRSVKQTADSLR